MINITESDTPVASIDDTIESLRVWGRNAIKSSDTANAPDIWPNWACRLIHREAVQPFSLWHFILWLKQPRLRYRVSDTGPNFEMIQFEEVALQNIESASGLSCNLMHVGTRAWVVPTHVTNNHDKVSAVCKRTTWNNLLVTSSAPGASSSSGAFETG